MGSRRVFVLPGIERLSPQGANSLLKVLEEPPKGTFLLMTTAAAAGVLTTIRSRAQLYRLAPLTTDAISTILEKNGMERAQAQQRALAARGSLRGLEEDHSQAPLEAMVRLCQDGLQLDLVAAILEKLPQRVTDEVAGKTIASEQRRVLSGWLELLLQRLRQELRSEAPAQVEVHCELIERVFRLQHDLQRHISPQVVIEGLALAAR
jgi:DNA polymerase III gamma/tau subunit